MLESIRELSHHWQNLWKVSVYIFQGKLVQMGWLKIICEMYLTNLVLNFYLEILEELIVLGFSDL